MEMPRAEHEVVVVGSGPNGLAAAVEMAGAGRSWFWLNPACSMPPEPLRASTPPGHTATCPTARLWTRRIASSDRWSDSPRGSAPACWPGIPSRRFNWRSTTPTTWVATLTAASRTCGSCSPGRSHGSSPTRRRSQGCTCAPPRRHRAAASTACAATTPRGRRYAIEASRSSEWAGGSLRWIPAVPAARKARCRLTCDRPNRAKRSAPCCCRGS